MSIQVEDVNIGRANVHIAAACTITALGVITIGSGLAAAASAAVATKVALTALILISGACGIASITAYFDPMSVDVNAYFNRFGWHVSVTIPATIQLASQVVVEAAIRAIGTIVYEGLVGRRENRR